MGNSKCQTVEEPYGNIRLLHPDGTFMGYVSKKQSKWYRERNLAVLLEEKVLQLTFKPNGKGHAEDEFYLKQRENICVVCKSAEKLTRHHVIPVCYLKFIPEEYKAGSSHDIVVLCQPCHHKYEEKALSFKDKLGEQYDCPVNGKGWYHDKDIHAAKGAARTLLGYNGRKKRKFKVPPYVEEKLKNTIKEFLGKEEITHDDLLYTTSLNAHVITEDFAAHSETVVSQITDYWAFVEMWRQHFLDSMQPQHLPEGWSVNHRVCHDHSDSFRQP